MEREMSPAEMGGQFQVNDEKADNMLSLKELAARIPDRISNQGLQQLRARLESGINFTKEQMTDNLKYAIPLKPLLDVTVGNSKYKAIDTLAGATGINMPMGLASAFDEATKLIGQYCLMLKTKREIARREDKK